MLKKKVVSLLCAAAMTLTAFNGVAFAADPEELLAVSLVAEEASVQPYGEAVYTVMVDPNNAENLAGFQSLLQFDSEEVSFAGYEAVDGNVFEAAVNGDSNVMLAVLPNPDMESANKAYEGDEPIAVGKIKFTKNEITEGELALSFVEDPIGSSDFGEKVTMTQGTIDPIVFEFKAELEFVGEAVAEMGYDYAVDVNLANATQLIENNHGIYAAQFDVNYDADKFVFNKGVGADIEGLDFDAREISDGVVRVIVINTDVSANKALETSLGTLIFKTKVVAEDAEASFVSSDELFSEADFSAMQCDGASLDVTFSREKIDSFMKDVDESQIAYERDAADLTTGKVSVYIYEGVQNFDEEAFWNLDIIENEGFDLKVIDKDGADAMIGTTSRFYISTTVIKNEGLGEGWEEEIEVPLYDLTMRIKGDVTMTAQNPGQLISVFDLNNLKVMLLEGIPADLDEDIIWAATNISYPDAGSDRVFIYDLFKVRYAILNY